eukprot:SAG22_NODE_13724_length_396_cov_131.713805_1_plen_27_part_10
MLLRDSALLETGGAVAVAAGAALDVVA